MKALLKLADAISATNRAIARTTAWASLAMVLLTFAVVVARYGFDSGSIALQEAVLYLHAVLFMTAAAGALVTGDHVRVDIFHSRFGPRTKAAVECLGALLLLLPFALFIGWASLDYVSNAWARSESSGEPGGLPWLWALKTLLLTLSAQLASQALADAIRNGHLAWGPR